MVNFHFLDGNSQIFHLKDFKGKPKLIMFWASWCPYCRKEWKTINRLYQQYGEKVDFLLIDVVDGHEENAESAKQFHRDNKFVAPIHFQDSHYIFKRIGVQSLPTLIITDNNGIVIDCFFEDEEYENISKILLSVL